MANTGDWIKAVDTIEPTVKLGQKGSLTEKNHKTHPGFENPGLLKLQESVLTTVLPLLATHYPYFSIL